MKTSLFFNVVIAGVLFIGVMSMDSDNNGKITEKDIDKLVVECAKELNSTKEGAERINNDEESAKLKERCLTACVWKKMGVLEKDRKLNFERLSKILHDVEPKEAEEIVKTIQECSEKVKNVENECEFMIAVMKCSEDKKSNEDKKPPTE